MNTSITLAQITSTTFTTDLKDLGMAYLTLADGNQSVVFIKEQDGFTVELFKTNHNNLAKSKLLKTISLLDGVDIVQAVSAMVMEYNGNEYAQVLSTKVLKDYHSDLDCKGYEQSLHYAISRLIADEHAQDWYCTDLAQEYANLWLLPEYVNITDERYSLPS